MADQNTTTASGTDAGKNEDTDTQETVGDSQTEDNQTDGKKEKSFTQTQVDKIIIKRLNDAKKSWEKDKDKSEFERLQADNDRLRKELNERNAFDDFDSFFTKKGVKNTRGLFRAMKDELEYNEKGKIENKEDLLKEAKSEFPEFFTSAKTDADGGKGVDDKGATKGFNDVIRRGFGR